MIDVAEIEKLRERVKELEEILQQVTHEAQNRKRENEKLKSYLEAEYEGKMQKFQENLKLREDILRLKVRLSMVDL